MKKLYVAIFCVLFSVCSLPASAQETSEITATNTNSQIETTTINDNEIITEDSVDTETTTEETTVDVSEIETTENTNQQVENQNSETGVATADDTTNATAETAKTTNIIISEINWAGSSLSNADEWIELYNTTSESVDISGWVLTGSATSGESLMLADGTIIEAQSTLLISNYKFGSEKTTLNIEPDLVTSSLSLPNTKLEMILATNLGAVIDEISDTGTPDFGSSSPKASMERNISTYEWITSTTNLNLLDKNQLGTPGAITINIEPNLATQIDDSTEYTEENIDTEYPTVEPPPSEDLISDTSGTETENTAEILNDTENINNIEDTTNGTSDTTIIEEDVNPNSEIDDTVIDNDSVKDTIIEEASDIDVIDVISDSSTATEVAINTDTNKNDLTVTSTEIDKNITEENLTNIETVINEETSEKVTTKNIEVATTDNANVITDNQTNNSDNNPKEITETIIEENGYTAGSLIITEFVSNPSDGNEWVEIYNPGLETIDLSGWTICDATLKKTKFKEKNIEPQNYIILENPKGQLNNDADEIKLIDPTGNIIDNISYDSKLHQEKGESTIRNQNDEWKITSTITKGSKNIYEKISNDGGQNTPIDKTTIIAETTNDIKSEQQNVRNTEQKYEPNDSSVSNNDKEYRVIAIASAIETGTENKTNNQTSTKSTSPKTSTTSLTTISGQITAKPDTFGRQIAYIDGAQLYFYYSDWPDLSVGDQVTITGEESSNRGEYRIKISNKDNIVISNSSDLIPTTINIEQALVSETGKLVTITGSVVSREGSKLIMKDDTNKISVIAYENTNITWSSIENSNIQITGVLRQMGNEIKLYPRSVNDIVEIKSNPENDSDNQPIVSSTSSNKTTPWLGIGLIGGILGILSYFFIRNRKQLKNNLIPLTSNI